MTVRNIISIMDNKIAPPSLAESWDTPGLHTGCFNTDITGVLVCLDADVSAIKEAAGLGFNMIISHHPLIFGAVSDVRDDTNAALCEAIRNKIAVFSAHTNLDIASGGINDTLARTAGITDIKTDSAGFHRFGRLKQKISLSSYIKYIKNALNVPVLNVIVPSIYTQKAFDEIMLYNAGASCGAFDGEICWAEEAGIDVLITGEIKHSGAIMLNGTNFITVCAGHYYTEAPGMAVLAERLASEISLCCPEGSSVPVVLSKTMKPPFIFV